LINRTIIRGNNIIFLCNLKQNIQKKVLYAAQNATAQPSARTTSMLKYTANNVDWYCVLPLMRGWCSQEYYELVGEYGSVA
jgi:hypothetical protein